MTTALILIGLALLIMSIAWELASSINMKLLHEELRGIENDMVPLKDGAEFDLLSMRHTNCLCALEKSERSRRITDAMYWVGSGLVAVYAILFFNGTF